MFRINECLIDSSKILVLGRQDKKLFRSKVGKVYRKRFNHAEFIGEELCDMKKIPTARYEVIGEGYHNREYYTRYGELDSKKYDFKIGSYDFTKKEYDYISLDKLRDNNQGTMRDIIEMCPTRKNKLELLNEMADLIALDTYMGQIDRTETNIMFKQDKVTKEMHLAPLYDFEYSLGSQLLSTKTIYENPLVRIKTIDDYKRFIDKQPKLGEDLKFYLDVDLLNTTIRSYGSRCLTVPDFYHQFYKEFDESRKELIYKIVR